MVQEPTFRWNSKKSLFQNQQIVGDEKWLRGLGYQIGGSPIPPPIGKTLKGKIEPKGGGSESGSELFKVIYYETNSLLGHFLIY